MASSSDKIVDMTVMHQIGLQRFSVGVVKRILVTLRSVQADIEGQIRAGLPDRENAAPNPQSLRLNVLLQQVRATQREAHRAIRTQVEGDLAGLAATEAEFINRLGRIAVGTEVALATVSAEQLRAATMSQPFQGKTLRDWTEQFEAGDARRMREQITIGYLEGESIPQIARRVRLTSKISEHGAESLVRTSVTHINARAVTESAKANPHLFPRYQWVSVLDSRTTPICQSRAGKIYRHGSGPMPPAHVNCRSTTYNLVLDMEPAEDLGFAGWLARQPVVDQRDVLGATRYKLYKEGGLTVDRFTDTAGRQLTLDELKARDTEAFRRAGL